MDRPFLKYTLHTLTSGLLLLLHTDELEAVIAHELSHLAHHDARLMTVVGGRTVYTDGTHQWAGRQGQVGIARAAW